MARELRPPIEHVDYLSDELRADITEEERVLIRSVTVGEPITDYHGFPEVQVSMMRNNWEDKAVDSQQSLAEVVLGGAVEVVEPTQPRTQTRLLTNKKQRRHRRDLPTRSAITITGPSDRIPH